MKEEWREEQAGIAAFTKASAYMKRELLWHLNEGEFDWREWFDRRPSSAFMRGSALKPLCTPSL